MTQPVEISGRTFHLRATMRALRAAKNEHGIDIQKGSDVAGTRHSYDNESKCR